MVKDKHKSRHHIIPRSRIPKKFKKLKRPWNTKKKIIEEHRAWHNFLFGNRLPCEAIKMIEEKQIKRGDNWEKGWKIVFGKASPKEAIEIIKKDWVLPECFNFKNCFRFEKHNKICPLLIHKTKGEEKCSSPFKFSKISYNNGMMDNLINQLISEGYLKTPKIIEAFRKIKREDFVLEDLKSEADINAPLPIGHGQTISQPLTVAFMLELLQPEAGDKILDIGSGSGWQTAMLAYIVSGGKPAASPDLSGQAGGPATISPKANLGGVFAIERIPELLEFGKKNVAKYNFVEKGIVEFVLGDGSKGLKNEAPFDKIIAAAAADEIPDSWKEQLKIGGRLVAPVKSSIWLLIKKNNGEFIEQEFPGFAFVPLISQE